jgi:hypothetical protein
VDQPALGQLGSLAQAARQKQLKSARGILLAIGILSVIVNIGFGLFAQNLVDREFDRELADIRSQGMEVDELQVEELRAAAVRATQISAVLWTAIGIVFIVLGFFVYRHPVPITITGLVLYIGSLAVTAAMAPETLIQGWIIKAFFIIGLFKAVQAAVASEKENPALTPLTEPSPT